MEEVRVMKGHELLQLPQHRQRGVGEVGEPVLTPVAQQRGYYLQEEETQVGVCCPSCTGVLHQPFKSTLES